MRHSTYVTLITVAAAMSWTVAAHFVLVDIGMMTRHDLPAKVCPRVDSETTACSIIIDDRDSLTLRNIASLLGEPIWRLITDNPTAPIAWRLTSGTSINVTRTRPAPLDPW
jgi:hypothetical protein